MAQEEDNWSTIDIGRSNEGAKKVEFEVEEAPKQVKTEESAASPKEIQKTAQEEARQGTVAEPENEQTEPEELKGIETNGAQKRIKQLIRQRKEREEEIFKLRQEATEFKKQLLERDQQLTSTVRSNIDTTESQLTLNIEKAKKDFKTAVEQSDPDGMVSAQEEISKNYAEGAAIREKKRAWAEYQARLEDQAKQQVAAPQAAQQQQQYDPKAIQWASKNDWFGKDQVKTHAALVIDAQLKEEGYDPTDDEYYQEVDGRLAAQFNMKTVEEPEEKEILSLQNSKPNKNSAQVVSGASRTSKTSSMGSNGSKVKLTQEDVRLANKWGIPLEKYAAEKLKVQEADGEYTTIN